MASRFGTVRVPSGKGSEEAIDVVGPGKLETERAGFGEVFRRMEPEALVTGHARPDDRLDRPDVALDARFAGRGPARPVEYGQLPGAEKLFGPDRDPDEIGEFGHREVREFREEDGIEDRKVERPAVVLDRERDLARERGEGLEDAGEIDEAPARFGR